MSTEQDLVLDIFVNPLLFSALDVPSQVDPLTTATPQMILDYLCRPENNSDLASLIERYNEINAEPDKLNIAPAEQHILEKLIWPLKNAKGSYMVGNYLGTIALCGMVAEMVAILAFEISSPLVLIHGQPIDEKGQEKLFGRTFEKLGQERRVDVLLAYGMINDAQKQRFDEVKNTRNRYLHLYSKEHTDIAKDAVKVFVAASQLVIDLIGVTFSAGKASINPILGRYLVSMGFAKVPPLQTQPGGTENAIEQSPQSEPQ